MTWKVIFGCYQFLLGSYGGIRASVILRPFIAEFGMISTPFSVSIPSVHEAIEESGKCVSERIGNNLAKVVKEVGWYADALKHQKEVVAPPQ